MWLNQGCEFGVRIVFLNCWSWNRFYKSSRVEVGVKNFYTGGLGVEKYLTGKLEVGVEVGKFLTSEVGVGIGVGKIPTTPQPWYFYPNAIK